MSGGGQEGGDLEADGVARILGLDASEFIKPEYTAILKKLAPTLESVDLTQYFESNGNEPSKNEDLKREVLNTSLSLYVNDMDITIESDSPTGITPETIQAVLDSLNLPIDIDKVKIKLAADGLTINIYIGDASYTPTSLPETPASSTEISEESRPSEGGFATLEEAAIDATERSLNDSESE